MLSSSSLSECDPLTELPNGREGIGVVQQGQGLDYPLVEPSPDVQYLIADMHFTYDPPHFYDDSIPFKLPFRIKWLSGFGCVPPSFPVPVAYGPSLDSWSSECVTRVESLGSTSSLSYLECHPHPVHGHDVIIVDADDRTVFDSTADTIEYATRTWGPRLQIVTWQHRDGVCRIVYHTAWNPTDFPEPRYYSNYFFPSSAVLDSRAVEMLPKRLRSLTVVLTNMQSTDVELLAGYNMKMTAGEPVITAGTRRRTSIVFDAAPGGGLGTFPGCEPTPLVIRRINGIGPTTNGDFYLSASGCYWIRQPTRVISDFPRTTLPEISLVPGSIPNVGLPDPLAGQAKNVAGWPTDDDPKYAHLQFGNDCGPCCDCQDYVDTATYMNDVSARYSAVGASLEAIRDQYHVNRARWLSSAVCLLQRPLRLKLLPQVCPYIDVAAQFCNQTDHCQTNVELRLDVTTSPTGATAEETPGYTFCTLPLLRQGRTGPETIRYRMGGTWPHYTAFFESVPPRSSVSVRFRLKISDCGIVGTTPYAVTVCLTAHVNGHPLYNQPVQTIGVAIPRDTPVQVCETQTLNCPVSVTYLSNLLTCTCEHP